MKNGAPISAVSTPTLISLVEGMSRTAISAASSSAAPDSAAGTISRPGSWPTSGRTRCGATSPTKPIEPATATPAPTAAATPATTRSRNAGEIESKALRRFLAERQRPEGAAVPEQKHHPDQHEGQRDQHMPHAAILERAEQPEGDLERSEGVRREVERKRRARPGEARDGETGEDQHEQAGARPGDEQEEPDRKQRADDRRDRQRDRQHVDEAERDDRHRAERRRRRRAEQRRRRQRVAEKPLQRRARQAERPADHDGQQRARQPDLDDDDPRGLAPLPDQPAGTVPGGSQTGPTPSETTKEHADQQRQAGDQASVLPPPVSRLSSRSRQLLHFSPA